ncbi:hypothetical protein CBP35_07375 [Acidovorax carolinensis]|nr:hypothetical protein CBP35_07375 [Acidovorax carolinensis]
MKSVDDRSRSLPVALALVLLLIAYGSLFPFQWNFTAPQPFIWSGRIGLVDLVENIVLFMPLGGLLGWAGQGGRASGPFLLPGWWHRWCWPARCNGCKNTCPVPLPFRM